MAEETVLPGAAEAPPQSDIIERSAGGDGPLSAREAALSLAGTRHKDAARQRRDDEQEGEARDDAAARQEPAAQESLEQADTAQETGPGETQGDDQAEPSIAPPRSWTKEDKELFTHLPRETQERLAERERSREADFLRRQNEASERLKGLDARQQEADKARTHYEQALPMLVAELQAQHQGEFADIQSIADLEKLAREDWPRYVLWDAQQKKIAAIQQQAQLAHQRQAQERAQRWSSFMAEQDALFAEKAPELADADAKSKAANSAAEMLKELGFSNEELGKLWTGQADISLRDHRLQLLIRDGVRYREAQAKAKASQQRPVPQVQRPGSAPARGADADERVKTLDDRLNQSGTLRDAAALLAARRAGARR
jgi:hypothetical protein